MPATRTKPRAPSPQPPNWPQFLAGGRTDERLRGRLLEPCLEKLKRLALCRATFCGGRVDWTDLFQEGYLGLVEAAATFDPARGCTFWTFSARRALGRMQDYLRTIDPLSRQLRGRKREAQDLVAALEQQLGHVPTPDEIAEQLGARVAAAYAAPVRLNAQLADQSGERLIEFFAACVERPESQLLTHSFAREVLGSLPMDDQCLLWMWAVRGATMKQLAEAFGFVESRISQRIAHALEQLFESLDRETLLADR